MALAVAGSFFAFFAPHAVVVTTRISYDLASTSLGLREAWLLKVAQSVLFLMAYFWHVARPALVILLDPELKVKLPFCGNINNVDDFEDEEACLRGQTRPIIKQEEAQMPLFIPV